MKPASKEWFAEALAVAEIADRLKLTMDEAAWLRERAKSKKGPYHWKVIYLFLKSSWRNRLKTKR